METDLKGKIALITGSTGGIGKETARGLLERGIKTILTARDPKKLEELKKDFLKGGIPEDLLLGICLDLSDLDTLKNISEKLSYLLKGEKISILIENAGVWPTSYSTTKQGYEIAFGTNVLGHFVLRKNLLLSNILSSNARIVILTGDIYILLDPQNFRKETPLSKRIKPRNILKD
jgi:NAD(P)-dependent dehydrogenase (short-subunit alcohol dehydrogenase family)